VQAVWWQQAIKLIVGLGLLLALRVGLKGLFTVVLPADFMAADLIRYFFVGLWLTVGAPYLFSNCNIQFNKK